MLLNDDEDAPLKAIGERLLLSGEAWRCRLEVLYLV